MSDKSLTCKDCQQEFAFTEGEQDFYRQKKLDTPQYCMICRGKYQAQAKDKSQYKKST